MRHEIAGAASVEIDLSPPLSAWARAQMDPYLPAPETGTVETPDLLVRERAEGAPNGPDLSGIKLQNDAGDGLTTAWDGRRSYVLKGARWCSVPDALGDPPATFEIDHGFPLVDVWEPLVRPALSLALLRHGAVAVHASSVELDGRAVLVAGWSESGKTEVALALCERGARFVSDKWTVIREDGQVLPYPISVGIRRWVVPFLPRLEAELEPMARMQFAGASLAGRMLPNGHRGPAPRLVHEALGVSRRVVGLAERVSMPSSRVRQIYGGDAEAQCRPIPLRACVLLETVRQRSFNLAPVDATTAAERLALAGAFERRTYFSIGQRTGFAGDDRRPATADDVMATETDLMTHRFGQVELLAATTPFPADPRGLAEAIERALI